MSLNRRSVFTAAKPSERPIVARVLACPVTQLLHYLSASSSHPIRSGRPSISMDLSAWRGFSLSRHTHTHIYTHRCVWAKLRSVGPCRPCCGKTIEEDTDEHGCTLTHRQARRHTEPPRHRHRPRKRSKLGLALPIPPPPHPHALSLSTSTHTCLSLLAVLSGLVYIMCYMCWFVRPS